MRKLIGLGLLLLLSGCGPVYAQHTTAKPAMDSVCNSTQVGKPSTWGLSYVIAGSSFFKQEVSCVLNDDRTWAGIYPAKPGTSPDFIIKQIDHTVVKELCGEPFATEKENEGVSCAIYGGKYAYINTEGSWTRADLNWRILLINHEIGHQLGYNHDFGAPCSVMHDAGCPVHPGAPWPPVEQRR